MKEEKSLDNKVLDHLDNIGAWGIKYWAGAKFTKKGIPDILACIYGIFYGIEDKSSGGRPTMLQLKNLEWIREAGGYGILLYPNDFENFVKFVEDPHEMFNWYMSNIELQNKWKEKLEKI